MQIFSNRYSTNYPFTVLIISFPTVIFVILAVVTLQAFTRGKSFYLGKISPGKFISGFIFPRLKGSLPFGRGSRVTSRGSRVNGRGSRVNGRGSRVNGRGSRVTSRGLRVPSRGSKNSSQLFLKFFKSKFRVLYPNFIRLV